MPRALFCLTFLLCVDVAGKADEPLHTRIDVLIQAKAKAYGVPLSSPADDAEFVRRVDLDFAGRVPTSDDLTKTYQRKQVPGRGKGSTAREVFRHRS
jgi:hypothetical protein